MKSTNTRIASILSTLKECSTLRDLTRGKALHAALVETGEYSNILVSNTLVNMYAKCGSMADVWKVFERMPMHNVVSWNALILGNVENGEGNLALDWFSRMQSEGCERDSLTFVAALKACSCLAANEHVKLALLDKGMAIHCEAVESRCEEHIFVQNSLVDMYMKCGSLVDARMVFDRMPFYTVISWTALLLGYVENGEEHLALEFFAAMQEWSSADSRTYVAVIKACAVLAEKEEGHVKYLSLEKGMCIHSQCVAYESDIYVASSLINMYSKGGSLADAVKVFSRMAVFNLVAFNALLLGYVENEEEHTALNLFNYVRDSLFTLDHLTFVAALKACTNLARNEHIEGKLGKVESLRTGANILDDAARHRCHSHIYVRNTAIDMYMKCSSTSHARELFEKMPHQDVVSWNALMMGYVENAEYEMALQLFFKMSSETCQPDARSYVAALKACGCLADREEGELVNGKLMKVHSLEKGTRIHTEAVKNGFQSDMFLASATVDMYAKCRSLMDARRIFDGMKKRDVVLWTGLILAYVDNNEGERALELFSRMKKEGCEPNALTYTAALKACASLASQGDGDRTLALKRGASVLHEATESSEPVLLNAAMDMYIKWGSLVEAVKVFEGISHPTVVSWNTLLLGYIENYQPREALHLFARMQSEGFLPNTGTFIPVMKACGILVDLAAGKEVHSGILRHGMETQGILGNSLVDLYGKCGGMEEGQHVFDSFPVNDLVTWNSLISGYSNQGRTARVFNLFQRMEDECIKPDVVTFVCLLTCCSRAGVLEKGMGFFKAMVSKYNVRPVIEHFHCMVDLLGRGNKLQDAVEVIKNMPFEANDITWRTVLAACNKWKNVDTGRLAFKSMLDVDCQDPTAYVLMANLYDSQRSSQL